jgi:hypothetical protein
MISNTNTDIVFVRLLEDGTDVMRPVPAVYISEDFYRLSATVDYDPEFETWEFPPNSKVRCERQEFGSDRILVAVELVVSE